MKNRQNEIDSYLNLHLRPVHKSFDFGNLTNIDQFRHHIYVSYIVICKNSQATIERCVNSIAQNMENGDELIVLDTGSTDETVHLVKKNMPQAKISVTNWKNDFSEVRNKALKLASKDWVFYVDSDEWLDVDDGAQLKKILFKVQAKNFKFVINPTFSDHSGQIYQTVGRIFPKKSSFHYYAKIHEEVRKEDQKLGYDVRHFACDDIILYHDGYDKEVLRDKDKIKRNIRLLQEMTCEEPQNARWPFLLARDGFDVLPQDKLKQLVKRTLDLVASDSLQEKYSPFAKKLLGRILLREGKTTQAVLSFKDVLQITGGEDSDAIYYIESFKINEIIAEAKSIEVKMLRYLNKHKGMIDVNSDISGNYYHIAQVILECDIISANYSHLFPLISEIPKNFSGDIKSSVKSAVKLYSKLQGDSKNENN
ncbi:plantaricin biosynthesis protein PlnO [Lactiplantibacillus plantarum]|uniref:UDP-GlcNAc glycosyltransferase family 2 n=2 Tax=Lactiplantibacillus plantarum TaxID=1590 RepID=E9K9Y6_LACPN|nr:glycosyltransferase [Lactiplantibacillus plantarum]ADV57361.1 UDP-GlcNAc glycosyltransferase family 2 [Lactiplantibacillus plantarum]MCG0688101.1 plantaricin biosynthesis protein PlnO [Lactiplantibacillus plantarum]